MREQGRSGEGAFGNGLKEMASKSREQRFSAGIVNSVCVGYVGGGRMTGDYIFFTRVSELLGIRD